MNKKGDIVYKNAIASRISDKRIKEMLNGRRKIYKIGKKYFSVRKKELNKKDMILIDDVTEKVMAENALKNSEEKYRAVCENSLIGIIIMKGKELVYANKKFEKITGYKAKKLNNTFFDLIYPEDEEKFEELVKKGSAQLRIYDKEGNIKWLEMGCCEIDYNGKAYLINAMDITKRKEMEEKLRKANIKMRKALEKEKKFLEEISHYFFNPLCIAKGYLDLSIPYADPSLKRKLEITKEAVTRVENVVKHIVTEGRIYE